MKTKLTLPALAVALAINVTVRAAEATPAEARALSANWR